MDMSNTSQQALGGGSAQGHTTPREPFRVDAASWVALAAFVAYIGIGLLA